MAAEVNASSSRDRHERSSGPGRLRRYVRRFANTFLHGMVPVKRGVTLRSEAGTVLKDKGEPNEGAASPPAKRDAAATRRRILAASRAEFSRHGFSGARIDRIARNSQSNVQMLYRYFGGKEKLYLTILEDTYERLRALERGLDLDAYEPVEGIRKLIEFTFDYLMEHQEFVTIIMNENMMRARFLKNSSAVPRMTLPLVKSIEDLMARGRADGVLHSDDDAMQLYVTILSLCFVHISNQHTLSVMFQKSLADPDWIAARRRHVVDVMLGYLTTGVRA